MTRCSYFYYSITQPNNPLFGDNQCRLEEGHIGEHVKPEIFPPAQQRHPQQGWIKQTTEEKEGQP